MREFRVLVVENDRDWNERLVAMYRELFGRIRPPVDVTVESARHGQEAVGLLRRYRYDLLSLDIILDGPDAAAGGGRVAGLDGRDLIEEAKKSCHGVVVITGFAHDDEVSKLVEFDKRGRRRSVESIDMEVRRERVAFGAFLADALGVRVKYFSKDKNNDIDLTVRTITEVLLPDGHPEVLLSLCRPTNRFARSTTNPGVWEIIFDGQPFSIKDYKGMSMLAQLLRERGREFTAEDLLPPAERPANYESPAAEYAAMSEEESERAGMNRTRGKRARIREESRNHPLIRQVDKEVAELKREATEIGERIQDMRIVGNVVGIERERERLEEIMRILKWVEKSPASADVDPAALKARKGVAKNIQDCLNKIKEQEKNSPRNFREGSQTPIYDHLSASYVRNDGTFSYKPVPPVEWDVP